MSVEGLPMGIKEDGVKFFTRKCQARTCAIDSEWFCSMKFLEAGSGASPSATDTVEVHYRGTFIDGREFDSSYSRNSTIEFPLNGVIAGWTEGLQLMQAGAKVSLLYFPITLLMVKAVLAVLFRALQHSFLMWNWLLWNN